MKTMLARAARVAAALALTGGYLMVPGAAAAANTCTWTGSGADANWATTGNWSGCGGVPPVNGDTIVFPNVASRKTNVNNLSGLSVVSLSVGGGYTITGNALTVTDAMTADTTTAGSDFSPNLTFGPHSGAPAATTLTHTSSSGNNFTVHGTITLATGAQNFQITADNFLNLNGNIGGSTHQFIINNAYTDLGGTNTFTASAGVAMTNANVWCELASCLGASSNTVAVNGNGSLLFPNAITFANDITCNTSAQCVYTNSVGADYVLTGHINLTHSSIISTQGSPTMSATINGPITGSGTLLLGPGLINMNGANTFTGAVTVNGTVTAGNATAFGNVANTVNLTSGSLVLAGGNFDLANPISGGAGLTVSSGAHQLTGTYTATGTVTVSGGSLAVNTDASSSSFAVSGGTVKGTGTLGATTLTGGTLAPGNSPGIMHVAGNLTLAASPSGLAVEINGPTVGAQYDQTAVTGTAALNGAKLDVSLGYTPAAGSSFTILTASSVTGQFAGLANGSTFTVGGTTFTITYNATSVVLTTPAAAAPVTLAPTGQDTLPIGLAAAGLIIAAGYLAATARRRPTIAS
ncbi:MAG TPA: hypothetical protein VLI05_06940 [Candidatus Saccharimonadia bacterium]|nr:hypothetical protein [Candidatus Saccharimonadia bacterium]